ncbi:MAG: VOC family protein [Aridibacter famidurans]|nr:VOC family protein [Aridibacter famidurans]
MRIDYAIVFVSDMDRSIEFYRDVVGLPLKFETPEWTEFATEGSTLALHRAREGSAGDANAPGTCRTGFAVPDIEAFHQRMIENGVECVEEPRESFEAKLAQYKDPDGMRFGVSESR